GVLPVEGRGCRQPEADGASEWFRRSLLDPHQAERPPHSANEHWRNEHKSRSCWAGVEKDSGRGGDSSEVEPDRKEVRSGLKRYFFNSTRIRSIPLSPVFSGRWV